MTRPYDSGFFTPEGDWIPGWTEEVLAPLIKNGGVMHFDEPGLLPRSEYSQMCAAYNPNRRIFDYERENHPVRYFIRNLEPEGKAMLGLAIFTIAYLAGKAIQFIL